MGQVNELKGFTRGQLDAALMKIGQDVGMDTAEGINAYLSGELVVSWPLKWREEVGVIYFSVKSDGTEGETWITRLESKGFIVDDSAKQVLRSPDFKPTSGVTTEVAVLKGMLFEYNDRDMPEIRAEGALRKLSKPNAELACLIRKKFTDKEIEAMDLWYIIAMHEPINDSNNNPNLLYASRGGDGRSLHACYGGPGHRRNSGCGFAFAVSSTRVLERRLVPGGCVHQLRRKTDISVGASIKSFGDALRKI